MPPLLWKLQVSGMPNWIELDRASYREVVTMIALDNVYQVVKAWVEGKAAGNTKLMQYYARLVGDGIASKD